MHWLYQKKTVAIYLSILLVALIMFITRYSFQFKLLNILLFIILAGYPVVAFFASGISWINKILITFIIIVFSVAAFWNLPVLLAMGHESKETLQAWKLKNKEVILERRQGWGGGPYLMYSLRQFRLFGLLVKTVASGYPESQSNEKCEVELETEDYSRRYYQFDRCENNLKVLSR